MSWLFPAVTEWRNMTCVNRPVRMRSRLLLMLLREKEWTRTHHILLRTQAEPQEPAAQQHRHTPSCVESTEETKRRENHEIHNRKTICFSFHSYVLHRQWEIKHFWVCTETEVQYWDVLPCHAYYSSSPVHIIWV